LVVLIYFYLSLLKCWF